MTKSIQSDQTPSAEHMSHHMILKPKVWIPTGWVDMAGILEGLVRDMGVVVLAFAANRLEESHPV